MFEVERVSGLACEFSPFASMYGEQDVMKEQRPGSKRSKLRRHVYISYLIASVQIWGMYCRIWYCSFILPAVIFFHFDYSKALSTHLNA